MGGVVVAEDGGCEGWTGFGGRGFCVWRGRRRVGGDCLVALFGGIVLF